jgi:heterodisulfide reductase subunit A
MAIAKSEYLEPLKPGQLSVNKATLVLEGGLAGITAALALADQGFESYIVEKENELGGNYGKLYYTLEGLDTRKHLAGLLERVEKSDLIHVFTGAKIKELDGFIGNYKTNVESGGDEHQFEHGVVIVATGAYENKTDEYFYGQNENVVTYEKDPKVSDAESVVMIQCVGSRNEERPYCSRYCCSEAIKNALKLKETDPDKDVTILYRDIRTYGFKEDYYKKAREENVKFICYEDEDRKPEVKANGSKVTVSVFDPILNERVEIETDILALSVGVLANSDNHAISNMLKLSVNQDGFFAETRRFCHGWYFHVRYGPVTQIER